MAKIRLLGTELELTISPAISILNTLMREGISIQHKCGGKTQCGTCRVRIVEGHNFLSPIQEREQIRLDALGNPEDVRLACQTHVFGDITIEILLPTESSEP